MIQRLYNEGVTQNDIIFNALGLTVYPALWQYALCTKLDHLLKTGACLYDMNDAVDYLDWLIGKCSGRQAVKKSELRAWADKFKFTVPSDDLIKRLGDEYKKKYGGVGIVDG